MSLMLFRYISGSQTVRRDALVRRFIFRGALHPFLAIRYLIIASKSYYLSVSYYHFLSI